MNYSLLDHDGVFLRVLRSQIECAEKLIWRISDCEQILPSIFSFLVSISDDTKGTDPWTMNSGHGSTIDRSGSALTVMESMKKVLSKETKL